MSYTHPPIAAADATWQGASTYERPLFTAADATWSAGESFYGNVASQFNAPALGAQSTSHVAPTASEFASPPVSAPSSVSLASTSSQFVASSVDGRHVTAYDYTSTNSAFSASTVRTVYVPNLGTTASSFTTGAFTYQQDQFIDVPPYGTQFDAPVTNTLTKNTLQSKASAFFSKGVVLPQGVLPTPGVPYNVRMKQPYSMLVARRTLRF